MGTLGQIIVVLLAIGAAVTAIFLVVWALFARSLQQRLRIDPKRRTRAPKRWLRSSSRGARLHRRLRTAVQTAARAADDPIAPRGPRFRRPHSELRAIADELTTHALVIEEQLVVGATGPKRLRRRALDAVEGDVETIESTAAEFARTAARLRSVTGVGASGATASVDDRLRALRQALDDLESAEHGPRAVTDQLLRDQPLPEARADEDAPVHARQNETRTG